MNIFSFLFIVLLLGICGYNIYKLVLQIIAYRKNKATKNTNLEKGDIDK